MTFSRRIWILISSVMACMLSFGIGGLVLACDVAVVSASASTTGRPFIMKNFDASEAHQQQIKYFASVGNGGAYLLLYHFDDYTLQLAGDQRCPQGGVNENGFAMVVSSVYEDFVTPTNETRNMNVTFMRQAIERCTSIADFESFMRSWPSSNVGKSLSGNFAVIDAEGGAALYEIYTGSAAITDTTTPVIQYRKCNANTGAITNESSRTATTAISCQSSSFPGWFARTNSHNWLPDNAGSERQAMMKARLTELTSARTLNPRNTMLRVNKDLTQGKITSASSSVDTKWNTTFCISRSATRSGMVVDGVASGADPALTTMWVCLGEPSIGVFVPYFPAAGGISPYAYMDTIYTNGSMDDTNDTSLLAMAEDARETYNKLIYNSNRGSYLYGPYDTTINKTELNRALTWITPIETTIFTNTDEFLNSYRGYSSALTEANLLAWSNYCAEYAYRNYTNASSTYQSWVDPVAGYTADTTPNAFTFTDVTNATLNTQYTSNTITVSGITGTASVSVSGGTYSKNGGTYTSGAGTCVNGDTFTVRHTSSSSYSTSVSTTLTIGGVSDSFTTTTRGSTADTTPDAFTFTDVTNATLNTQYTSNTITVSGITGTASVSVSGGTYSINGGSYTSSAGTCVNGNTITVRHTSSSSYSTSVSTTLTIGGVSDTFTTTTVAQGGSTDSTPDAFTFTDLTGVALNTVQTSNTFTVSGINTTASVSITGGSYSKNGTSYTSSGGTCVNGDTFTVQHTSSGSYSTAVNTSLTIGGVSDTFTSTTLANSGGTTGTPSLSASISIQSWGVGYVATVTVSNRGTAPTSAWRVVVNLNGTTVTNVWNATVSSSTFSSVSYNGTIPAGGSTTFGFQGLKLLFFPTPTISSVSYTAAN